MFILSFSMAKLRILRPCSKFMLGSYSIGKPSLSKLTTSSSVIAKISLWKFSKFCELSARLLQMSYCGSSYSIISSVVLNISYSSSWFGDERSIGRSCSYSDGCFFLCDELVYFQLLCIVFLLDLSWQLFREDCIKRGLWPEERPSVGDFLPLSLSLSLGCFYQRANYAGITTLLGIFILILI